MKETPFTNYYSDGNINENVVAMVMVAKQ